MWSSEGIRRSSTYPVFIECCNHPKESMNCMDDSVRPHVLTLEIIPVVSLQLSQYHMYPKAFSGLCSPYETTDCLSAQGTHVCGELWDLLYHPNLIAEDVAKMIVLSAKTALGICHCIASLSPLSRLVKIWPYNQTLGNKWSLWRSASQNFLPDFICKISCCENIYCISVHFSTHFLPSCISPELLHTSNLRK